MRRANNEIFDGGKKQISGWKEVIPHSDISYQSAASKLRRIVEGECTDYTHYEYGDGIFIIFFTSYFFTNGLRMAQTVVFQPDSPPSRGRQAHAQHVRHTLPGV